MPVYVPGLSYLANRFLAPLPGFRLFNLLNLAVARPVKLPTAAPPPTPIDRTEGKGDAVRKGFALAQKDILMILDADLTVPPEELPRFDDALVSQKGNSSTVAGWSIRWKNKRCDS